MTTTSSAPKLREWVRRLSEEEMPVFAHTARRIAAISSEEATSAAELAQVILQDSAMTARVLRMANSVYYNPSGHPISTVSRAVVMLGFDVVRSISISVAMVDTLLRGERHRRVMAEMARSFHAAVQAKAFAELRGDPSPEEVFIAALLYRLGHMVFWCFPYDQAEAMEAALAEDTSEEEAERKLLGFSLTELTAALNHEWHLSKLLGETLTGPKGGNPRSGNLELGQSLAHTVEEGWGGPEVGAVIARIADYLYKKRDDVVEQVHNNARRAKRTAEEFGAQAASELIPLPGALGPEETVAEPEAAERAVQLQLDILRELSNMLSERVDLNTLLGTVLEGIYRGIGVDRALFALVSADGQRISAKYALGVERERFVRRFDFELGLGREHMVEHVLNGGEALWVDRKRRAAMESLFTDALHGCLDASDFLIMPLSMGGRPRGLFYADRRVSGRPFTEADFQAFRHFCEQAAIGLALLGQR